MKSLSFLAVFFVLMTYSVYAQDNGSHVTYSDNKVEHWMMNNNVMDTINGNWISILAHPIAGGISGVLSYYYSDSNKVFVAGGVTGAGTWVNNTYMYDPVTNTYSPRANIPTLRGYGRMVRCRGKFYLIGTTTTGFTTPDGGTYEYDPVTGAWVTKAVQPAPLLTEMSVCVWRDSLIITIGGSTSGFTGAVNSVRVFDPVANTWTVLSGTFLQTEMSGGAACIGNEIWVAGGYNGTFLNTTHRGTITPGSPISISWRTAGASPFNTGIYRCANGVWNGYALFGPTQNSTTTPTGLVNGIKAADSTMRNFLPSGPTVANRELSVAARPDSVRFYCHGGYNGAATTSQSERYAFVAPAPPFPPAFCCGSTAYSAITGGTPGPAGDDVTLTVSCPFTINYNGVTYTQVSICTNGFCVLGSSTFSGFTNDLCATTAGHNPMLAPFYDDLNTTVGGTITYTTLGTTPNRVFVVQYDNVAYFTGTGTVTCQIRIYEAFVISGTNMIDYSYGTATPNPSASGSIGLSNQTGGSGNILSLTPAATCGNTTTSTTVCNNTVAYNQASGVLYRFGCGLPVVTGNNGSNIPTNYFLAQNYPNPFNPTTTIKYGLPKSGVLKLVVYDLLGREVKTLVNEFKQAGSYEINFNASSLASGVYLYRIEAGDFIDTKKLLLVK